MSFNRDISITILGIIAVLAALFLALLPVTLVIRHQLKKSDIRSCDAVLGEAVRRRSSLGSYSRLNIDIAENQICIRSAEKNSRGESWWFTHASIVISVFVVLIILGQIK